MEAHPSYIFEATENEFLKFGEVFLLPNKWEVNFKCSICHMLLKSFRKFLRHSIEHSYVTDDDEIEKLIETSLNEDYEDEINKETFYKDAGESEFESEEILEASQKDLHGVFVLSESSEGRQSAILPNQIVYEGEQERKAVPRKIHPKENSVIVSRNPMFNIEVVLDHEIEASETLTKESGKSDELPHPSDTQKSTTKPYKKGQSSLQCPDCDKIFPNEELLDKHVAIYRPYLCEVCNARLRDKGNFIVHKKRHLGIKKHICEQCGKRFITTTELKFHINVMHSDVKPFECTTCGLSFKLKRNLLGHIVRAHSDRAKSFACNECHKSFYDKRSLEDHLICHNPTPAFTCTICDKKVARKKALTEHMKLHSNEFKYSCSYCDKKFQQNAGLYSHMRNVHKKYVN